MLKNSGFGHGASRALGRIFRNFPLHPNIITVSAVFFAFFAYLSYPNNGWLSFSLFGVAFLTDAIDGAVARAKNLESRKGAFLDGITDRIVEFLLILALFNTPIPRLVLEKDLWLLIILFFGTGMTSFVKAYAEHTGAMHHAHAAAMPGILERAERSALIMAVFALALLNNDFSAAVLMFVALLSFLTFLERFARVLASPY